MKDFKRHAKVHTADGLSMKISFHRSLEIKRSSIYSLTTEKTCSTDNGIYHVDFTGNQRMTQIQFIQSHN